MKNNLTREEIVGALLGESLATRAARAGLGITKKAVTWPLDLADWVVRRAPSPSKMLFIGQDSLGRQEILGLDDVVGRRHHRGGRGRGGSVQKIQRLKEKAAAGDQQAAARLQKMQAALSTTTVPGTTPSSTTPWYYSSQSSPTSPAAYPPPAAATPTTYPAAYPQYLPPPAAAMPTSYYGSPAYDPYADPYAIDVYQGDVGQKLDEILGSFVGADEIEAARDGGGPERRALARRAGMGYNSHWKYMRGEGLSRDQVEELRERAKAGDSKAADRLRESSKSSGDDASGRQQARKILEDAADQKKIYRGDLKRAIDLYAGPQATTKEKVAVGMKMLSFLSKRKVELQADPAKM